MRTRSALSRVLDVTGIELLHQALVFALGSGAALGGADHGLRPGDARLVAALPSASNVSLLGADNGRIARIILATTVLAFLTFSVMAELGGSSAHSWLISPRAAQGRPRTLRRREICLQSSGHPGDTA